MQSSGAAPVDTYPAGRKLKCRATKEMSRIDRTAGSCGCFFACFQVAWHHEAWGHFNDFMQATWGGQVYPSACSSRLIIFVEPGD